MGFNDDAPEQTENTYGTSNSNGGREPGKRKLAPIMLVCLLVFGGGFAAYRFFGPGGGPGPQTASAKLNPSAPPTGATPAGPKIAPKAEEWINPAFKDLTPKAANALRAKIAGAAVAQFLNAGGNLGQMANSFASDWPVASKAPEPAEAAAEPMWDAPGDMGGFDGLAAGSTGSRSSSRNRGPASRPAPTVPVAQAETGRDAVERSIQRNEERSSLTLTETDARRAAGRNFERLGGVWVQTDIGGRSVDERVGYMSEEYFALLRDHPELRDVLALGERVRFELGGRIYEIVP